MKHILPYVTEMSYWGTPFLFFMYFSGTATLSTPMLMAANRFTSLVFPFKHKFVSKI